VHIAGAMRALFLLLLTVVPGRATTLATVGDSFADSFYYGLRARPDLLKQNEIDLIRWSRPSIGLSRNDQFDYAGWLRDSEDLGTADYCVVQVGTNDAQSIPDGPGKWVFFPTQAWQNAYVERVQKATEALRNHRCRRVIWALQPGFEKSKFLSKNRELINKLQSAGVGNDAVVVDTAAESGDYGRDGIHFSGPYALKLADATLRIVITWRERVPESCFACHIRIAASSQLSGADMGILRMRETEVLRPASALVIESAARSVTPPRVVVKAAQKVARRAGPRRRRHHA
jgi:hypothetical protein